MVSIVDSDRFSDRKYFFRIQKLGWRLIGFWPGSNSISTLQLVLAILNGLEVLIYGVFQLTFCYVNRNNLVTLLDALTPVVTQITSAMKMLVIVWRRHDIKIVLDYLKESFYNGTIRLERLKRIKLNFNFRQSERKQKNSWKNLKNFIHVCTYSLYFYKLDEFVFLVITSNQRFISTHNGLRKEF